MEHPQNPIQDKEKEKKRNEKKKGTDRYRDIMAHVKKSSRLLPIMIKEYKCPLKFVNSLPEIPIEPKFVALNFDVSGRNQLSNSSLYTTYKYPIYPPTLDIPYIGYDKFSRIPPSVTPDPKDVSFLKFTKESSLPDTATKSIGAKSFHTSSYLKEVEYNGDIIFNDKDTDEIPEIPAVTSPQQDDSNHENEEKITDIEKSFDSFTIPANPVNAAIKPVRVWDILPDQDLFCNNYILARFESMDPSLLNDNQLSIIIRTYEKTEEPKVRSQSKVIIPLGEVLKKNNKDNSHYDWKNTYNVNTVDLNISKSNPLSEKYLLSFSSEMPEQVSTRDSQETVPRGEVLYTPLEPKKLLLLKKCDNGLLSNTDIIVTRESATYLDTNLYDTMHNPEV
ncbi:hypothetical protein WA158_000279 [Blastocystis sp. Blastoise]